MAATVPKEDTFHTYDARSSSGRRPTTGPIFAAATDHFAVTGALIADHPETPMRPPNSADEAWGSVLLEALPREDLRDALLDPNGARP